MNYIAILSVLLASTVTLVMCESRPPVQAVPSKAPIAEDNTNQRRIEHKIAQGKKEASSVRYDDADADVLNKEQRVKTEELLEKLRKSREEKLSTPIRPLPEGNGLGIEVHIPTVTPP